MKAIVYREYGSTDVLRLEEIEKPVVGDDDVLLRVHAASVNPIDWHFMRGSPYLLRLMLGLRKPRVARLGIDAAGKVDAVGRNVTQFKPGDEVFGACRGAFAEYACTPQSKLAIKPVTMTFEQAASVPVAGLTALQGLRDEGGIRAGQKVLINGASGGVGTFAVQIAKFFGADVTGVCSARNAEMVRSIGADRVIDYAVENFTQGGERYDLIFDCMGNHAIGSYRRVLDRKGTYIVIGGPNGRWIGPIAPFVKAMIVSPFVGQKLAGVSAKETAVDLRFIGGLIEAGKVRPVIDRCYEFSRIAEAVRYVEAGHARGKVIITVDD